MVLLVPLIATDFRSIWPDTPLRWRRRRAGALFFAFGPGRNTSRERILALLIFLAIAGIFAYGYFSTGAGDDAGRAIRALAVGLCGLIFAALFSEALGARSERGKPTDPLLAAYTREQFADALRQHRLIGIALIMGEDQIAPLPHPGSDSLIAERSILRRAHAPWGRDARDDGSSGRCRCS